MRRRISIRPNVFLINYTYTIPKLTSNKALGRGDQRLDHRRADRGAERPALQHLRLFGLGGELYFGTDVEIANPIVPLKPGVTAGQANCRAPPA